MIAISVVFFEALWNVDFFFRRSTGKSLIGLSAYMFDPKTPLFIRGLSCFHIAATSLDALPAWVRSARFCLADNCRAGGPAAFLSGEQPTGECELGLRLRPNAAEDSARAAVCDSLNAVVPARCLSADTSSFRQNLSSCRVVEADKANATGRLSEVRVCSPRMNPV